MAMPLVPSSSTAGPSPTTVNASSTSPKGSSSNFNTTAPGASNIPTVTTNPAYLPRPSIAMRCRVDGTHYRPITPLEAIYYHERLDLVTHPLIKGNRLVSHPHPQGSSTSLLVQV